MIVVKVVILLAGKGRRMGAMTDNAHKALVKIHGTPALGHLVNNLIYSKVDEIIPIVGHCSDQILSFLDDYSDKVKVTPVFNNKYNETNNLFSLSCAKDQLKGNQFVVCNGDVLLDREILRGVVNKDGLSAIVVDDTPKKEPIDSPSVIVEDGRIYDLGRHISFEASNGYAIGVYKFSRELSRAFFEEAVKMLDKDLNAGFHDPLPNLFQKFSVYKHSTRKYLWTDIDTFEDIEKARNLHEQICNSYLLDN